MKNPNRENPNQCFGPDRRSPNRGSPNRGGPNGGLSAATVEAIDKTTTTVSACSRGSMAAGNGMARTGSKHTVQQKNVIEFSADRKPKAGVTNVTFAHERFLIQEHTKNNLRSGVVPGRRKNKGQG